MRIKNKNLIILVILLGFLGVFGIGFILGSSNLSIAKHDDIDNGIDADEHFDLRIPKTSSTFLDNEAGIAYYTNVSQTLNLATAKAQFRTIEADESDYVVGSLEISGLPETEDVHCFVHKDGWVVTYYLDSEPASKIIDWTYYSAGTLSETKLSLGLDDICLVLGITPTYYNYFNFEYPNANKLKIVIEEVTGQNTDSFDIQLTSTFTYYERSWAHATSYRSTLDIDSSEISSVGSYYGKEFDYGELTPAQLTLDVFHTVEIWIYNTGHIGYGAIVLVYYDP